MQHRICIEMNQITDNEYWVYLRDETGRCLGDARVGVWEFGDVVKKMIDKHFGVKPDKIVEVKLG